MPLATAHGSAGEVKRPPVRLRTLLLLALAVAALGWAHPRAKAAWQLYAEATALADYALCMVGSTGPSLIRDNPRAFERLVRRRLVTSAPNERPFHACANLARQLIDSNAAERIHLAAAWDFVEYGGTAADRARQGRPGQLRIGDLRVTTRRLAELSVRAWPFVRSGYLRLVKPSTTARRAVHVIELPRPAIGRGLPAWRARYRAVRRTQDGFLVAVGSDANLSVWESRDGGVRFNAVSAAAAAAFAERCPATRGRSYTFGLTEDTAQLTVASLGPDAPAFTTELASSELTVFAAACDEHALVVALRREDSPEVTARVCPFRSACTELSLPRFAGVVTPPRFPLDLARIDGVTVLAVSMHGIVRVASSRDAGRSWTPYCVAFDLGAHPTLSGDVSVPDRLLALGSRLLLYAGAPDPTQDYFVLASDDAGASWRTPETPRGSERMALTGQVRPARVPARTARLR